MSLRPSVGFISGWVSLLVGFSAPIALAVYAFGAYAEAIFPDLPARLSGAVLLVLLTLAHLLSGGSEGRVMTALTVIKSALVVAFVLAAVAIGQGETSNFAAGKAQFSLGAFGVALVLVCYSYSGWNVAAYIAGELKDPTRNLPRVLLLGTSIAVAISIAVNLTYLYAVPPRGLAAAQEQVAAVAAGGLFGPVGKDLVSVIIALALLSSASAMIMAGPRVYTAMAEDGMFFRALAIRDKRGVPWVSIMFQSLVSMTMLFTSTFIGLLTYVGFTLSAFTLLTVIALFVIRARSAPLLETYRAAGWPYSGVVFIGISLVMIFNALANRPLIALAGAATIIFGFVIYYIRTLLAAPSAEPSSAPTSGVVKQIK